MIINLAKHSSIFQCGLRLRQKGGNRYSTDDIARRRVACSGGDTFDRRAVRPSLEQVRTSSVEASVLIYLFILHNESIPTSPPSYTPLFHININMYDTYADGCSNYALLRCALLCTCSTLTLLFPRLNIKCNFHLLSITKLFLHHRHAR